MSITYVLHTYLHHDNVTKARLEQPYHMTIPPYHFASIIWYDYRSSIAEVVSPSHHHSKFITALKHTYSIITERSWLETPPLLVTQNSNVETAIEHPNKNLEKSDTPFSNFFSRPHMSWDDQFMSERENRRQAQQKSFRSSPQLWFPVLGVASWAAMICTTLVFLHTQIKTHGYPQANHLHQSNPSHLSLKNSWAELDASCRLENLFTLISKLAWSL